MISPPCFCTEELFLSFRGALPPPFFAWRQEDVFCCFRGAGALPPLFRLCEQRENFSRSPIFPSLGEERTICLPFSRRGASDLSPLLSGGGGYLVFCPPPLFGEGRSVFRRRRKGVGVLDKTRDLLQAETNPKKSRRLLPPRARESGRAAPPSEREARGCLPAPQIRCALKQEDRCRVLRYWRVFPPSRR